MMKFLLDKIGKERMPSVLKNPFSKMCVKRIYVSFSSGWSGDTWSANGSVEFSNGNTKGEQKFTAETFDEVVRQIKGFIDELQQS